MKHGNARGNLIHPPNSWRCITVDSICLSKLIFPRDTIDQRNPLSLMTEPASPLFSVIILNWNGRHLLKECLDSVLAQNYRDFETILVDNGSNDGSVDFLRTRYGDQIRLVPLDTNAGFGGGNNRGIESARGKWVVFLNNDTQADPRWLEVISS